MSNKVLLKKSSVAAKVPLTSDLDYGELALNYADGKIYFKNSSNVIKSFTIDDSVVTLTGTQTLTNKTLTSPTINSGALSGTFSGSPTLSGAITISNSTASSSTSTGALIVAGGVGVAGSIYADQIRLMNNGNGTNVYVGDDTILGDINSANTLSIRGQQDSTQGYIVFGSSNSTSYIGRSGTNPITVTGQFKVDSGTVNGVAYNITGYAYKGGTGYHDFLSVTNSYVSATNPNKYFRMTSNGSFEILNSAYTTTILSLSDSGTLAVPAISAGGSIGTVGQVLSSTGSGLQWVTVGGTGTVTSIVAGTGLTGGTITTSGTIALATSGATAGSYGSATAIPAITVDSYGRITAISTNNVSTTISLAGTTGTGSVSGGGTLTFASGNGVTATAATSTITINTPQDVRTTATPSFSTVTSTVATGTAPLTVTSTTMVTNLNVDYLDGQHGSYYTTAGNLTGTISSTVLGNSTHYIGTTAVALNRASANLALTGISSVTFPGSTSGTIQVTPAAVAGTGTVITLPATTGTVITSGDSGTVTSTMIADGTIVNGDISASAAIAISKLAASTISGVSLGSNLATLTLATSGTGLSGSTTYNGSGAATFTVTSNATSANTASAIVARDVNGDFNGRYINASYFNSSDDISTGSVTYIMAKFGDNYHRSASAAKVAAFISGQSMNISGTSTNITAYTINQSVGTSDNVQHNSLGVGTAGSGTAGEIRATNQITSYYSDARLKNFSGKIDNALSKVLSLNGYYFTENEVAKSLGYNNDKRQVGVSAQEVEAILPEIVVPAPIDADYKTVQYEKLVPLLIEAIKEQQQQIEELKAKLGN